MNGQSEAPETMDQQITQTISDEQNRYKYQDDDFFGRNQIQRNGGMYFSQQPIRVTSPECSDLMDQQRRQVFYDNQIDSLGMRISDQQVTSRCDTSQMGQSFIVQSINNHSQLSADKINPFATSKTVHYMNGNSPSTARNNNQDGQQAFGLYQAPQNRFGGDEQVKFLAQYFESTPDISSQIQSQKALKQSQVSSSSKLKTSNDLKNKKKVNKLITKRLSIDRTSEKTGKSQKLPKRLKSKSNQKQDIKLKRSSTKHSTIEKNHHHNFSMFSKVSKQSSFGRQTKSAQLIKSPKSGKKGSQRSELMSPQSSKKISSVIYQRELQKQNLALQKQLKSQTKYSSELETQFKQQLEQLVLLVEQSGDTQQIIEQLNLSKQLAEIKQQFQVKQLEIERINTDNCFYESENLRLRQALKRLKKLTLLSLISSKINQKKKPLSQKSSSKKQLSQNQSVFSDQKRGSILSKKRSESRVNINNPYCDVILGPSSPQTQVYNDKTANSEKSQKSRESQKSRKTISQKDRRSSLVHYQVVCDKLESEVQELKVYNTETILSLQQQNMMLQLSLNEAQEQIKKEREDEELQARALQEKMELEEQRNSFRSKYLEEREARKILEMEVQRLLKEKRAQINPPKTPSS